LFYQILIKEIYAGAAGRAPQSVRRRDFVVRRGARPRKYHASSEKISFRGKIRPY